MRELATVAGSTSPVRSGIAVPVVLAVLLLLCMLPALLRPGHFIQDDSYFYLQIASHIVAGHGSTFHEVTPTNGYHPLWMAAVVGVMALADGDKSTALNLVVVLQILLTVATLLLFKRLTDAMAVKFWAPGLAVLAFFLLGTGVYASEAHLNALLLVAAVLSLWRSMSSEQSRAWFWTGLLFGAAILARLDNVFVAFALLGVALLARPPRELATLGARAGFALLGGAVVLVPYLAHNALSYGHLMPISGAIKSVAPGITFNLGSLGPVGKLAALSGLACLAIGAFDSDRRRRVVWLGLGTGVLLHALYVVAFTDHYTFWPWYYVSGALAASLAASHITHSLLSPIRTFLGDAARQRLVLIGACILLAACTARAWLKAFSPFEIGPVKVDIRINQYRWPEELAAWMKANLPRDSIVYAEDWPGAIAYYSDLNLLPMDGLVNDFAYNDDLLRLGVETYLCSHGVDYILGHFAEPTESRQIPVTAPWSRQPAGVLTLDADNIVVETRSVLRKPEEAPPFAIWRTACPGS